MSKENDPQNTELDGAQAFSDLMTLAERKALHLRKTPAAADEGIAGSWLGGEPTLPADIDWPWFEFNGTPIAPMHFLGQLDLAQLPADTGTIALPTEGTLFFFADPMVAPAYDLPPNSGCVIYVSADCTQVPLRSMPDLPTDLSEDEISYHYQLDPTHGYKRWPFTYHQVTLLDENVSPDRDFRWQVLTQNQAQYTKLDKETRTDRGRAMVPEYSGAFAFHRLFGDACGRSQSAQDASHLPLITFASDPDTGFVFDEMTSITFWISPEDLNAKIFSNAYVGARNS